MKKTYFLFELITLNGLLIKNIRWDARQFELLIDKCQTKHHKQQTKSEPQQEKENEK